MFVRQNAEARTQNGNRDGMGTEMHFKGLEACESISKEADVSHTCSFGSSLGKKLKVLLGLCDKGKCPMEKN